MERLEETTHGDEDSDHQKEHWVWTEVFHMATITLVLPELLVIY